MGYRPGRKLRAPQRDRVSTRLDGWVNFNPSSIADLVLWLDAADSSTITQSGGVISQWNDKSNRGNNAVQASGTRQPAYISAGQNGLNTVRYDGTTDSMSVSNFAMSGSFTVFAAFNATQNGFIYEHSANASTNDGAYFYTSTGNSCQVRRSAALSVKDATSNYLFTSTWITGTHRHNGLNLQHDLWKNGSLLTTLINVGAQNNVGVATVTTNLFIGSRNDASVFFKGDFGELLFFNNALTFTQIDAVNRYLKQKWATA